MIPFITIVDLQREARLNSPSGVSSPAAARDDGCWQAHVVTDASDVAA